MKPYLIGIILSMSSSMAVANQKTMECSMQGVKESLILSIPKEGLPEINFFYPVKTKIFSMHAGNFLLVILDKDDSTRTRLVISAQFDKHKKVYTGQMMADWGGNQLQIDNGPVTCKLR